MTTNKNRLMGKWEFIKTETHNGSEWKPTKHVKAMTWEFFPEYVGKESTFGIIVESAPGVAPVRLSYTHNDSNNSLYIEIYTDSETRIKDEIDIYDVCQIDQSTIVLSLINQIGCPPPYLQYTLQQIG